MKRVLYFDASAGVSGDMFVGALLDLGASLDVVRAHVASLCVGGLEIRARRITRGGIAGTKFDVLDPETGLPVEAPPDPHPHPDDAHAREHPRARSHCRAGEEGHPQEDPDEHPHWGVAEIRSLIRGGSLPALVADSALAVFERLAAAEARVHGSDIRNVHLHEVGALDAIADIVSAASAFHQLGVDEAWCSPIHVGSGTVRCAHGVLPVPAPATLELLRGAPAYSTGVQGELATPTGVALVRHFCTGFAPMPPMVVEAVGYGAGSKDYGFPNLFRATLGLVSARVTSVQTTGIG